MPTSDDNAMASRFLPEGYCLEHYLIKRVLGAGGFGTTYLAEHTGLHKAVAIKEYFPQSSAYRDASGIVPHSHDEKGYEWGLDRFMREARTLARFRHPAIVAVQHIFATNNTAYLVMDYEEGQRLNAWLQVRSLPPSQSQIDSITTDLLDALELMHDNRLLHRDIAPDNIIIRPDGSPVLLDFGSAREDMERRSHVMSAIVKSGYSPPEQYSQNAEAQGPWSDIYALGATLYETITGNPPLESTSRMLDESFVASSAAARGDYRTSFLDAVDWSLKLNRAERPQSIAEWRPRMLADSKLPLTQTARTEHTPSVTQIDAAGETEVAAANSGPETIVAPHGSAAATVIHSTNDKTSQDAQTTSAPGEELPEQSQSEWLMHLWRLTANPVAAAVASAIMLALVLAFDQDFIQLLLLSMMFLPAIRPRHGLKIWAVCWALVFVLVAITIDVESTAEAIEAGIIVARQAGPILVISVALIWFIRRIFRWPVPATQEVRSAPDQTRQDAQTRLAPDAESQEQAVDVPLMRLWQLTANPVAAAVASALMVAGLLAAGPGFIRILLASTMFLLAIRPRHGLKIWAVCCTIPILYSAPSQQFDSSFSAIAGAGVGLGIIIGITSALIWLIRRIFGWPAQWSSA